MKLSQAQRQIMLNQYVILSKLNPEQNYDSKIEILYSGFTTQYHEVLNVEKEEYSEKVQRETIEILDMFRYIKNSLKSISEIDQKSLDLNKLTFQGFDGNDDEGHFHFCRFMITVQKLWREQKDASINSHSYMTLPVYRRMLLVYKRLNADNIHEYNLKQLLDFSGA